MQQDIKFSVIVPIYNVEKYIHQCVDSLINQTYKNVEIILVDDGSPDSCPMICDAYAQRDGRITVVHKPNGGLVSARKAGASVCSGDYILNVDSDDYIAPTLLEEMAKIIARHQPDLISFDGYRFYDDVFVDYKGSVAAGLYEGERLKQLQRVIIHNAEHEISIPYGICLKAVRKELYLRYQMASCEKIIIGEDMVMTVPMTSASERVYISDFQGYYYRDNPKSITNSFHLGEIEQMHWLVDALCERLGEEYSSQIDSYVLVRYFDFLDRAIYLKSFAEYKQIIARTLDDRIRQRISRVQCTATNKMRRLVFLLMKREMYTLLWLLRKIKKRKG